MKVHRVVNILKVMIICREIMKKYLKFDIYFEISLIRISGREHFVFPTLLHKSFLD